MNNYLEQHTLTPLFHVNLFSLLLNQNQHDVSIQSLSLSLLTSCKELNKHAKRLLLCNCLWLLRGILSKTQAKIVYVIGLLQV